MDILGNDVSNVSFMSTVGECPNYPDAMVQTWKALGGPWEMK